MDWKYFRTTEGILLLPAAWHCKMVIKRFLDSGMTMEEISVKMDASEEDLTKLLNSECTVDE